MGPEGRASLTERHSLQVHHNTPLACAVGPERLRCDLGEVERSGRKWCCTPGAWWDNGQIWLGLGFGLGLANPSPNQANPNPNPNLVSGVVARLCRWHVRRPARRAHPPPG